MVDPSQFRSLVVVDTLIKMGMWSQASENLLVGTALVESNLTYIKQLGGGPAVGFFQMEPNTAIDIANRYMTHREQLGDRFARAVNVISSTSIDWGNVNGHDLVTKLICDMRFACAMARLRYWMVSAPLPDADDIEGLAQYWKDHYNTAQGAGKVSDFIEKYRDN